MTTENTGIVEKLYNLDIKWIHLGLMLSLAFSLVVPLGLPLSIGSRTQNFYDIIDNFPEGTVIHYGYDVSAGSLEQMFLSDALYNHLLTKNYKIVYTSNVQEGQIMWDQMRQKQGDYGKTYGEDFIFLGFIPGFEAGLANLATDMWTACGEKDYQGTPLSELPMMADIKSAEDFDVMIVTFPGDPFFYLRQWTNPYSIPTYCTSPASLFPLLKPYEGENNQIISILVGARGAAEYDFLLGRSSTALASMDAQSFGHMYTFAVFLLGNIIYTLYQSRRKEE